MESLQMAKKIVILATSKMLYGCNACLWFYKSNCRMQTTTNEQATHPPLKFLAMAMFQKFIDNPAKSAGFFLYHARTLKEFFKIFSVHLKKCDKPMIQEIEFTTNLWYKERKRQFLRQTSWESANFAKKTSKFTTNLFLHQKTTKNDKKKTRQEQPKSRR